MKRTKIRLNGGKVNKIDMIVKDVELLMSKIILNDIPKRGDLDKSHTLQHTKYWRGADVCVIKNKEDIPRPRGFYDADEYILTERPYETSWVLCELRDIYSKNDFYDFNLKYILFGLFLDNYNKYNKKLSTYKDILLKSIQDMIYSENDSFLPCECCNEPSTKKYQFCSTQKEINNYITNDMHIGAES